MRIGTRITLTTSAVVALALGAYGLFALRSLRGERLQQFEREGREIAASLRAGVEARREAAWVETGQEIARSLERAGVRWRVAFLAMPPPDAPTADPDTERLRRMATLRTAVAENVRDDGRTRYVLLEPVREPAAAPLYPEGFRIIGGIQVSRDLAAVDDAVAAARTRTLVVLALLGAVMVLVLSIFTRRGIGKPIGKLITGIDGVAKGDLSQVLLQEREDEIGALAARFNDMTQSLRDARAETRRGVEERLALESHLRNASQMATIGQLAAEIAHEVGTPLNVVTGRARAMAKKADDPEAVEKNATIIAEQAGRITRIIQRLLDVARRKVGTQERATVDLNKLAEDTLELLEHQIANARVRAQARTDATLAPVPGDRDQLQQVLLNLYMNAIQAMPQGGGLDVRTSRERRRRPGLELAPEQGYAVIEVSDTGVGIPAESREKIFEAFYTSKGGQGGTGLGLAVAHGIVKDHDGWIELFDNAAGRGTVFRVYLPLTETASVGRATGETPALNVGHNRGA